MRTRCGQALLERRCRGSSGGGDAARFDIPIGRVSATAAATAAAAVATAALGFAAAFLGHDWNGMEMATSFRASWL